MQRGSWVVVHDRSPSRCNDSHGLYCTINHTTAWAQTWHAPCDIGSLAGQAFDVAAVGACCRFLCRVHRQPDCRERCLFVRHKSVFGATLAAAKEVVAAGSAAPHRLLVQLLVGVSAATAHKSVSDATAICLHSFRQPPHDPAPSLPTCGMYLSHAHVHTANIHQQRALSSLRPGRPYHAIAWHIEVVTECLHVCPLGVWRVQCAQTTPLPQQAATLTVAPSQSPQCAQGNALQATPAVSPAHAKLLAAGRLSTAPAPSSVSAQRHCHNAQGKLSWHMPLHACSIAVELLCTR